MIMPKNLLQMNKSKVALWLAVHPLTPIQIDCATSVMLKILDQKCKMAENEKIIMQQLYDEVKHHAGHFLKPDLHELIKQARHGADDELRLKIYEQRILAETIISRPIMKSFKAMIREHGLLNTPQNDGENK